MRPRVLVVDDEPAILVAMKMALEDAELEAETASTGEAGLALHGERPFDLLLLDKDLPGISGIEMIRTLRSHGDLTPVIVMTGHASVDSAINALNLGIDAYVDKPFDDIGQMGTLVRTALRKKRAQSATGLARVWRMLKSSREPGPLAILVAAADAEVRGFLVGTLATMETQVAETADADDALTLAQRATPDVVVLDGSLEHDISDFVRQVLACARRAACVVVDSDLNLATVERLTALGTKAVLTEAPGSEALRRALVRVIEQIEIERTA
jgi:DNA-binding response OmpR family regulator